MSYGYYNRAQKMHWYDWFTVLKNRGKLSSLPHYQLYLLYPPEPPTGVFSSIPETEIQQKAELAQELFTKKPELLKRFGFTMFAPTSDANKKHPVFRFVQRQTHWMNQGMNKQAAYDKTELEFRNVFLTEQKHAGVLKEVAAYGSAVNYYSFYQKIAEYEGKQKVKRLANDLSKHDRNKNMAKLDEVIPESFKKWERIKARYYSQNYFVPPPSSAQEIKNRFSNLAEFLVSAYSQKAAIVDGLRILTDEHIMWDIKDMPMNLQKTCRALYRELADLGVFLTPNGEVNLSKVRNPELRKSLQESSLLKLILITKGEYTGEPEERVAPKPEPVLKDEPGKILSQPT